MAKVQQVSASTAKNYYYEKDPVFNEDGEGENLQWSGSGAEALNLSGKIDKEEFNNILEGKSKDGSTQLKDNSLAQKDIAGYDMVTAAPKSVSILALMGDKEIIEIHNKANQKAMELVESKYANVQKTRTDENGVQFKEQVNNGNLAIAQALHSTARATNPTDENPDPKPQPHLHTHNVILNQVFDKETGEYRAFSPRELMHNTAEIQNEYKAELAKGLSEAGYVLEAKSHGFDIKMDQKIIDAMSSRKNEIMNNVSENSTAKEREHEQHNNKQEKGEYTKDELMKSWKNSLKELGTDFQTLQKEAKTGENKFELSAKDILTKVAELNIQNEATITEKKLLNDAVKIGIGQYTQNDFKQEIDKIKKIGQTKDTDLKLIEDKNGQKTFTNKGMYDLERDNIKRIKTTLENKDSKSILSEKDGKDGLKKFEDAKFKLTEGQYKAAESILTSTDQVQVIQGVAGSGKSTMLGAIHVAIDASNKDVEVILLAPTNKASQGAKNESKLDNGKSFEADTIAGFLAKNGDSVEKFDDEINKSARIIEGKETNSNVGLRDATEAETAKQLLHDYNVEKYGTVQAEAMKENSTKIAKEKLNEGMFIKTGNEALKEGFNASIKHKQGRSTKVHSGKFKGTVKKEDWSKKGTYKSEVKLKTKDKDGTIHKSTHKTEIKFYGEGIGKIISSGKSTKKTNSDGTTQKDKSNTFMGLTYASKNVKADYGTESKKSFDVLKLAAYSTGKVKTKNKEIDTTKIGVLGFSKIVQTDKTFNKDGDLVAEKKTTNNNFMGLTFNQKIDVADVNDLASRLKIKEDVNGKNTYSKDAVVEKDLAKNIVEGKESNVNKDEVNSSSKDDKQKLIIIDESSMLSAKDLNQLLKIAEEKDYKIAFMGDNKQLLSISSGDSMNRLIELTKTTEMKESQRQLNDSEKTIANNVRDKETIKETFKELESSGKIHEIKDDKERVEAIASAAVKVETLKGEQFGKNVEKTVDYKSNVALAGTRKEVEAINNAVKEKLHDAGIINKNDNIKTTVRVPTNMKATDQLLASNFEKGDTLKTFSKVRGMAKGAEYEITGANTNDNTLNLKAVAKNGKEIHTKVDLHEAAGKLSLEKKEDKEFSKGDIVIISKTDKKQKILNSERGEVIDFDKNKGTMKVDFGENGVKDIDLKKENGVKLGYAMTNHAAQGISIERVQANFESKNSNSLNSVHVSATRQKLKFEAFTDNKSKIQEQAGIEQEKTSTLNYKDEVKEDIKAETKDSKLDPVKDDNKALNEVKEDAKTFNEARENGASVEEALKAVSDSKSDEVKDDSKDLKEDAKALNEVKEDSKDAKDDFVKELKEATIEKSDDIDLDKKPDIQIEDSKSENKEGSKDIKDVLSSESKAVQIEDSKSESKEELKEENSDNTQKKSSTEKTI